jgi:hypothetical protein
MGAGGGSDGISFSKGFCGVAGNGSFAGVCTDCPAEGEDAGTGLSDCGTVLTSDKGIFVVLSTI